MPIDPDKLLSFQIPEIRQRLSARDAAFYALSIGVGYDPLDKRQLQYVCPDVPGFQIFPSYALVVAHPGFWLGHPDSGVDPRGVLHANQALRIIAPLPIGQTVVSRSRVTRLVDKGAGKAALLDTQTVIEDERGNPLAQLDRTTFLRGGGGFGGENPPSPAPEALPEGPPDRSISLPTRPEQALYYRMNGDDNPLHSDPEIAAKAGFERPILHGLCTAGVVCHAVLKAGANYEGARFSALSLRFAGYVLPGETLVTEFWNNGRFRARVQERDTLVVDDGRAEFVSA
ncbi:MaoC/PaaZ C-terminal domain-containing protein [Sphingobium subterraneum]|uniref:Acyl dehydratase n=1 Tax=Sphingobium subterraneum TaxID=627688 RepID=A0A841IXF7_9SPHN|nr:MaoC/PaaZ C-terminal domain-containing protein [Sphingobium subterraneum]MBB6122970.1 acyl dehydratase [Sphingobium subterraneum]